MADEPRRRELIADWSESGKGHFGWPAAALNFPSAGGADVAGQLGAGRRREPCLRSRPLCSSVISEWAWA